MPGMCALEGRKKVMKEAQAILWPELNIKTIGEGLLRRARYHEPDAPDSFGTYIESRLKVCCPTLPRGVAFSFLRLLCNGLNTSKRYRNRKQGGLVLDCPWCGHLGGDSIWHFASCPKMVQAIAQRWPRRSFSCSEDSAMRFFCCLDFPDLAAMKQRFLLADLVVKCYQSRVAQPLVVKKLDDCIQGRLAKWILCRGQGYVEAWSMLNAGAS